MKKIILVSFLAMILMGCVGINYTYKNTDYDNPEKALAAQKNDITEVLNKIGQSKNRIGGTVAVILPPDNQISAKVVKVKGKPDPKQIGYIVNLVKNDIMLNVDSIKKYELFDSVNIKISDTPENEDFSQDYAVYLFIREDSGPQWFVKNNKDKKGVPVYMDNSLPTPEQRLVSWLENIVNILLNK